MYHREMYKCSATSIMKEKNTVSWNVPTERYIMMTFFDILYNNLNEYTKASCIDMNKYQKHVK